MFFFFFKQKTAYEMRISDWSSDVCSSDLVDAALQFLELDAARQQDQERGSEGRSEDVDAEHGVGQHHQANDAEGRSEERRVGKECGSKCRSRWSSDHSKKK